MRSQETELVSRKKNQEAERERERERERQRNMMLLNGQNCARFQESGNYQNRPSGVYKSRQLTRLVSEFNTLSKPVINNKSIHGYLPK